jgi:hypothetical protein
LAVVCRALSEVPSYLNSPPSTLELVNSATGALGMSAVARTAPEDQNGMPRKIEAMVLTTA